MVPSGRSGILAKRRRRKAVEEWKEWHEIDYSKAYRIW